MSAGSDELGITLTLNGTSVTAMVEPSLSLLDFVRGLGATGAHAGCEHGVCGACTVLLDGLPVRACIVLAVQADGSRVETVESLGDEDHPGDLQVAMSHEHALQCGYCTPGFLMLADGLLRENPAPDDAAIRAALSSNLCRCTGYEAIQRAVKKVVDNRRTALG